MIGRAKDRAVSFWIALDRELASRRGAPEPLNLGMLHRGFALLFLEQCLHIYGTIFEFRGSTSGPTPSYAVTAFGSSIHDSRREGVLQVLLPTFKLSEYCSSTPMYTINSNKAFNLEVRGGVLANGE